MKEPCEEPLLATLEIMAQSNRKSICVQSDLGCGHNKSVENGAFVLISTCVHLCMVYSLIIQTNLVTKLLKIDASWDILKWADSFGSDYRYYVKCGGFLNNFRERGSIL